LSAATLDRVISEVIQEAFQTITKSLDEAQAEALRIVSKTLDEFMRERAAIEEAGRAEREGCETEDSQHSGDTGEEHGYSGCGGGGGQGV
jgi:hypothetical protein